MDKINDIYSFLNVSNIKCRYFMKYSILGEHDGWLISICDNIINFYCKDLDFDEIEKITCILLRCCDNIKIIK